MDIRRKSRFTAPLTHHHKTKLPTVYLTIYLSKWNKLNTNILKLMLKKVLNFSYISGCIHKTNLALYSFLRANINSMSRQVEWNFLVKQPITSVML